jgi:hypothetical protein
MTPLHIKDPGIAGEKQKANYGFEFAPEALKIHGSPRPGCKRLFWTGLNRRE